ncbi:BofC C-terminal domain-containing protein [Cytobacillus sp. FJAT-53684]|uniref:BofC C-terminal domain-containing protein n=1 Tax=Cytobacillus mangrovibacter TaxID=3299024 RepID=A0ABW6K1J7_9BACI
MSGESIVLANDQVEKKNPLQMHVILERIYVDGEISQESITETIWSMADFWAKYDGWQLIDSKIDKVVFRMQMDDISPLLKSNGYFGVTEEGVLTIFNGRPHKTNIIQSFFQIDLGRLESKKCEELKKGIPIKSKETYVEVLETFKSYSKEEKLAN